MRASLIYAHEHECLGGDGITSTWQNSNSEWLLRSVTSRHQQCYGLLSVPVIDTTTRNKLGRKVLLRLAGVSSREAETWGRNYGGVSCWPLNSLLSSFTDSMMHWVLKSYPTGFLYPILCFSFCIFFLGNGDFHTEMVFSTLNK